MSQCNQTQDVSHVTVVTRVMGMEGVFHVVLMSVVLRTSHPQQSSLIVFHVMMMGMDVGSVTKGITSMMLMFHANNVRTTHAVQDTLMSKVPLVAMNVRVIT